MMMRRPTAFAGVLLALAGMWLLSGCGGDTLVAYTGGGLPPGEPDLGGIVVASVDSDTATAGTAQETPPAGTTAIPGATVELLRGRRVVGRTVTGEAGYFRFDHPDAGIYLIRVTPPADRDDLTRTERTVSHPAGGRTFVTLQLPRSQQAPDPPGVGPVR